ncbi:ParA family protein [Pseudomonas sp. AB12(2023)]|uniref:ParA family protein n=1 Tax=Pseudomonas sp. AB12(2023) TaxID=3048597 RepID=UPI002B23BBBE|nr:ParA family protein [Pseudomonas sp. AB12(2023)]MEB0222061.1 ParA family protein [Pseudomonas sp. AB12(2023)]
MQTQIDSNEQDVSNFTDFTTLLYPPQFAADCLGLTTRRLKDIEEENDIQIRRVPRGTVTSRAYTLSDIFTIASVRRAKGHTKSLPRQVRLSTFVQKGGTGKTTYTVNFAIYAQFCGHRTLVVDNDPQGDTSSVFGYDPDLELEDLADMGIPADRHVNGHLGNLLSPDLRVRCFEEKSFDQIVKKPFGEHGPHLIPADAYLDDLAVALDAENNSDFWYASWLERAINGEINGLDLSSYDIIIFDNAPTASRLTKNSIVASDFVICPVRMDKFSFRALNRLSDWMVRFSKAYRRSPGVLAVPTMFIRNRKRIMANLMLLNDLFPGRVTDEKLYYSEDYGKALDLGIPLIVWKGASSKTIEAMRMVFSETLSRIKNLVL